LRVFVLSGEKIDYMVGGLLDLQQASVHPEKDNLMFFCASLHPQVCLILDEFEQIGHLGGCFAEAPCISFFPQFPSNECEDGISTSVALSCPLLSPNLLPVKSGVGMRYRNADRMHHQTCLE
jgi:hypothetical protein